MEVNPRRVFEQMFGRSERSSILDGTDLARLQQRIGPADRTRVDAYLERVRAVERRLQQTERHNAMAAVRERPEAPLGVPDAWEEHVTLMFELQLLALEADLTRVVAFKLSRDTNNRVFPGSGVRQPFHTLSHHSEKPELIRDFAKINRYHAQVIARFLERMRATPDGDGNLLDHSLVLYGSPMGDSNTHNHRQLPILLAGHAGGRLKGNLHHAAQPGTPHANTLVMILDKLNVPVQQLSDSTGTLGI
jgi:hypothetical protein